MRAQTLIFGIGAAKSGTSWLHDFLRGHEQVYLRHVKELHYFDSVTLGGGMRRREMLERRIDLSHDKLERPWANAAYQGGFIRDARAWQKAFDGRRTDDAAYLDYLRMGAGGARVIGEVTPSYALLSRATFARMAALASKVRFVYLLREPVARVWSALRSAFAGQGCAVLAGAVRDFLNGGNRAQARRSDYRRTLRNLLGAVPRASVHVEFYERLFSPEAIGRLSAFLGIAPAPADFRRRVHASGTAELSRDERAGLRAVLAPQYEYVRDVMGELPGQWTQMMGKA